MEKFKNFMQKLMANALFWVFAIFSSLLGFIQLFERFAHFSVDKIYSIF